MMTRLGAVPGTLPLRYTGRHSLAFGYPPRKPSDSVECEVYGVQPLLMGTLCIHNAPTTERTEIVVRGSMGCTLDVGP